jgi:Magnetochrome domain
MKRARSASSRTGVLGGGLLAALVAGGVVMGRERPGDSDVVSLTLSQNLPSLATPPALVDGVPVGHEYRGPCTNCHIILPRQPAAPGAGNSTTLTANPAAQPNRSVAPAPPADQGFFKIGPDIRAGQRRPHGYRGPCTYCHKILP